MIIRKIKYEQLPDFLNCCEKYLKWVDENTSASYEWCIEEATKRFYDVMKNGVIFVALESEKIIGGLAIEVVKFFMSKEKVGSEIVWHCNDDLTSRQKYRVLKKLADYARFWAMNNGIDRLVFSAASYNPSVKLLKNSGFVESETFYEKEFKNGCKK